MFIEMSAQTENEMQFICPIDLLGHPKTLLIELVVQDLESVLLWSFFPIYRLVKQKVRDAEVALDSILVRGSLCAGQLPNFGL